MHVLTLMIDKVAHYIMETLSRVLPASLDVIDSLSKPTQSLGFQLMLGFHITDAGDRAWIPQLQLFKNDVFFRMMVAFGIILKIFDYSSQNFVIRRLGTVKNVQFLLQHVKQFFDVSVLFEQNLNKSRHQPHSPAGSAIVSKQAPYCELIGKTNVKSTLGFALCRIICLVTVGCLDSRPTPMRFF